MQHWLWPARGRAVSRQIWGYKRQTKGRDKGEKAREEIGM